MKFALRSAANAALLLLLLGGASLHVASAETLAAERPLALLLAPNVDAAGCGRMIAELRAAGVQVDHAFPPRLLLARLTPAQQRELAGREEVERLLESDGEVADWSALDPRTRLGLRAFRRAFGTRGGARGAAERAGAHRLPAPREDALPRPEGFGAAPGAAPRQSGPPTEVTTSEFMIGTVVVGMVLPQSNGVAEPSSEEWTSEMVATVAAEALLGLDFYTQQHAELALTFIYHFGDAPPPGGVAGTVACDYEAIEHPMFDDSVTTSYFASLGYHEWGYFNNSYAWIGDLRDLYGADWGFVVQCAANRPESSRYADGRVAASYVGGPITAMSYVNDFYGVENFHGVLRHETLHIFGAMDEYVGNGTEPSYSWGYLGVANANSISYDGKGYRDGRGEGESCLALSVLTAGERLCPYTWGQIGWLDSDGDDLPDPVDTHPISVVETEQSNGPVVTLTGLSEVSALEPTRDHWGGHWLPVSINHIVAVEFSLEGRSWLPAEAVDGAFDEWQEEFRVVTPPLPDGSWEIRVRARNDVGNLELSPVRRRVEVAGGAVVDAAPFAVARVTPARGGVGSFFAFDAAQCGDLEEPTSDLEVRWDFDGDGTFDTGFSRRKDALWHYAEAATYAARVEVRDAAGQSSSSSVMVVVEAEDTPPVAKLEVWPAVMQGEETATFLFDAGDSFDAETPAEWLEMRWDWENDGIWDTGFSRAPLRPHTYAALGSGVDAHSAGWTVRVEVRDAVGNSATTTHYLWANAYNHAPRALLDATPRRGVPGATFSLDGEASSDPDQAEVWDDPVLYRWDFDGDGVFDTPFGPLQGSAQTSLDEVGVYAATLEVRDRYQARARTAVELAVSESGTDTPPVAAFSMRAARARVASGAAPEQVRFLFDAGLSTDAESPTTALEVRWDWESDGVWDTPFSTEKHAGHLYWNQPSPVVTLEVRDPEGLRNRVVRDWDTDAEPTPPLGLTADVGSERVTLSWLPHGEADVTGYRVYRRLAGEPGFDQPLAELGLVTSYSDPTVVHLESYVYVVTAVDAAGQESSLSDEVVATLDVPLPPEGLTRSVADALVRIHWNAAPDPDIDYYNVYLREVGNETWIDAGSTWDLEWSFFGLTNDVAYEFTVRAHDEQGKESDAAEPVSGTPRGDDTTAPVAPRNLQAALGDGEVLIGWDPVKGDDIYLYIVSRADDGSGEYELFDITYYYETALVDPTVVAGFSYCYVVQALDSFGNMSPYSAELCVEIPE